jgi:hypothetical protein
VRFCESVKGRWPSASKDGLVLPLLRNSASFVGSALSQLQRLINELAADRCNRHRGSPDALLRVQRFLRRPCVIKVNYDRTK